MMTPKGKNHHHHNITSAKHDLPQRNKQQSNHETPPTSHDASPLQQQRQPPSTTQRKKTKSTLYDNDKNLISSLYDRLYHYYLINKPKLFYRKWIIIIILCCVCYHYCYGLIVGIMQQTLDMNQTTKKLYYFVTAQCIVMIPIILLCYYEFQSLWNLYQQYQQHHQNQQHNNNDSNSVRIICMIQLVQYHMIPLSLIICIISGKLLPISISAGIAAIGVTAVAFMTIPLSSSSSSSGHKNKKNHSSITSNMALGGIVIMIIVLLIENFLIWVVSATYENGYRNLDTPLQDNGQIILQKYILARIPKSDVIQIRHNMNVPWCLVSCLATSFLVIDLMNQFRIKYRSYYYHDTTAAKDSCSHYHRDRTLYSIGYRGVMTISIARVIRSVAFSITVLPSQITSCYQQRFTSQIPPPTGIPFITIGLLPRSHGGCNDLIISGHAVITSTLACIVTSTALYYAKHYPYHHPLLHMNNNHHNHNVIQLFAITIWYLLIFDYCMEIYEGFHYSVDMWLGLMIVILLWIVLEPIEKLYELPTTLITKLSSTTTIAATNTPFVSQETSSLETTTTSGQIQDDAISSSNSNHHHDDLDDDDDDHKQNNDEILSIQHVLAYSLPALVAYLQVIHVLPNITSNFLIVLYTIIAAVLHYSSSKHNMKQRFDIMTTATTNAKKNDFDDGSAIRNRRLDAPSSSYLSSLLFVCCSSPEMMLHYGQHILFCLLYMTFGIYL